VQTCSGDFLDKQPSNEMTEQMVFDSWNLMVRYHNDTYKYLRDGSCRFYNSWLDAATDLADDQLFLGGGLEPPSMWAIITVRDETLPLGLFLKLMAARRESGQDGIMEELTGTWDHYYTAIRKTNMIITRIESVPKRPVLE